MPLLSLQSQAQLLASVPSQLTLPNVTLQSPGLSRAHSSRHRPQRFRGRARPWHSCRDFSSKRTPQGCSSKGDASSRCESREGRGEGEGEGEAWEGTAVNKSSPA